MPRYLLVGLILFLLACGISNVATQVETSVPTRAANRATRTPRPTTKPTTRPQLEIYKVGDRITVNDHTIVLNSVDINRDILKANFTLTNNGNEGVNVSSIVSFDAKDNEGVLLDGYFSDCGTSFNGEILPTEKLKGDICWKLTGDTPYRIYYRANVFSEGAIIWEINP